MKENQKLLLQGTGIFILFIALSLLTSQILRMITSSELVQSIVAFTTSMLLVFICRHLIQTDKVLSSPINFTKSSYLLLVSLLAVFVIYSLLVFSVPTNVIKVFKTGLTGIISSLLAAMTAGFFEEWLVRGIFFKGLMETYKNHKFQYIYAAVFSSLLFGFLHIINLSNSSWLAVSQQIFYAIVFGLVFSAIRIAMNGLWWPILLHSIIDFQPQLLTSSVNSAAWGTLLILFTPLCILSLVTILALQKNINLEKGKTTLVDEIN